MLNGFTFDIRQGTTLSARDTTSNGNYIKTTKLFQAPKILVKDKNSPSKTTNGVFLLKKDKFFHDLVIKSKNGRELDSLSVEKLENFKKEMFQSTIKFDKTKEKEKQKTSDLPKLINIEKILKYSKNNSKSTKNILISGESKKCAPFKKLTFPEFILKPQGLSIFDIKKTGLFNSFANTNLEKFSRKDINLPNTKFEYNKTKNKQISEHNTMYTEYKKEIKIEKSEVLKKNKKIKNAAKHLNMLKINYQPFKTADIITPSSKTFSPTHIVSIGNLAQIKTKETFTQTLGQPSPVNKVFSLSNSISNSAKNTKGHKFLEANKSKSTIKEKIKEIQSSKFKGDTLITQKTNLSNNKHRKNLSSNLYTNQDLSSVSVTPSNKGWELIMHTNDSNIK